MSATVLCAALVLVLELAGAADYLEATVVLPYYFKTRHALGLEPALSPQLKLYVYDDIGVTKLQHPDLTLDEWILTLEAIDARSPRAIVVDKVFAILFDPAGCKVECLTRLRRIRAPVYVGAFAAEQQQRWRAPLDLSRPLYELPVAGGDGGALPPHTDYSGWTVYGPHPELAPSFAGAGHLHYDELGRVDAFLSLGNGRYVPALPLLVAGDRRFENGSFRVDGRHLALDRHGRIPVNFVWPDVVYAASHSLASLVVSARQADPAKGVAPGDTVLILAAMFTGATDFHKTPVGTVPGGIVQASLLNSVLGAAWLVPLPHAWLLSLGLCVAGALWGAVARSLLYWSVLIAATALPVALGACLFVWQDAIIPLALPIVGFWGCSLIQFAERTRQREQKARRIEAELSDAAEMAKVLRPDELPDWDGMAIAAFHKSLTETSGDWFAFASSPSGRMRHFILADVAGHGVQAALIVSVAKTVLAVAKHDRQEWLESPRFIAEYLQRLNLLLFHQGRGQHLLTMLGVTFDREGGCVHYTSCGHPAPILFSPRTDERLKIAFLPLHTTLLGLAESVTPIMKTRPLHPGEELVCYTDGMPVGRSLRRLNQFFVDRSHDLSAAPKTLFDQLWELETRRSGRRLDDDVSVVWFKAA